MKRLGLVLEIFSMAYIHDLVLNQTSIIGETPRACHEEKKTLPVTKGYFSIPCHVLNLNSRTYRVSSHRSNTCIYKNVSIYLSTGVR